MVHLFRGRGFPRPRPPLLGPRHMRPLGIQPDFAPPFGIPRSNLLGRPAIRPRPLPPPPPRMARPPLPPRPRLPPPPVPMRGMPFPPIHPHPPGRSLGFLPPPVPPGPPIRGLRPQLPMRGRGMFPKRGVSVKRLVPANGLQKMKKNPKRKEKTEELEISKPWVTEALKSEIQKKYKLFEVAKEKKNDADWQAYKDQRILVGKMTSTAKLEYIGMNPEADVDQIMFGASPKGPK